MTTSNFSSPDGIENPVGRGVAVACHSAPVLRTALLTCSFSWLLRAEERPAFDLGLDERLEILWRAASGHDTAFAQNLLDFFRLDDLPCRIGDKLFDGLGRFNRGKHTKPRAAHESRQAALVK